MRTPLQVYNLIYYRLLSIFKDKSMSTDKASRQANKLAVKHTWYWYNNQEHLTAYEINKLIKEK